MRENNIKVVATSSYLPASELTNEDLEKLVDTSDEWIQSRTGIKKRRIAKDETVLDLAYRAAKLAIKKIKYDVRKIDLIICATISSEHIMPSVASSLQGKLKLNDQEITCFDLNAACTGFIYALNVATQMLNSGNYKSALIVGAEKLSNVVDYTDRNTCVLFGDGAGAMIIENSNNNPAYFYTSSSGDLQNYLYLKDKIKLNGPKVYEFAITIIPHTIKTLLKNTKTSIDDIDMIIPHQANYRIINAAANSLNISNDKFYVNIRNYGNTSAASVIIALDEYLNQKPRKENQKIMLIAFGGGFTWGGAILSI
ncbi:MAG TPA: ketoacyl-ACP synthase III [Acholeplasmataceae bacterium]|jgi:3-oxoacyl-[acyl-carrier-protein] synthase-3|nr:ketoacyl-ACP synthase III [Acholeplasmataceae bacterium]